MARKRSKSPSTIHHSSLVDEVSLATGEAARLHELIRAELLRDGPAALSQLQAQGQQWMQDLGVTFSLHRGQTGTEHVVPFDPYPRIISADEWDFLQRAVRQRLTIWNAFLKDIYRTQEVLRADIIPYHWVYDDINYHRGGVEVPVTNDVYAHVAAFDLVRASDGHWVVTRDTLSFTTGSVYAVQARNVLQMISPALLENASLEAVDEYPTQLLEHLRRHAPVAASEPRVALFSPGPTDDAYFEHSSLARQMGVPLLQSGDLTVLNSRVYFKTIGGLEPIDVLYRRLDARAMDPLEFGGDSQAGVAGLMNCVRKGTVTIVNALGSGLADNRAIATAMPRLSKFYLNEPLLLPTCERYVLEDPDQREVVRQDLARYLIMPLHCRSSGKSWTCDQLSPSEQNVLWDHVTASAGAFVAEPQLPLNLLPCVTPDGLAMRHVGLRLFALGGDQGTVTTSALTRYSSQPNNRVISSGLGGGIKDTWVLKDKNAEPDELPIVVRSGQRRLRLGSRAADSLYWMGRYTERGENITRALQVLQLETLASHSSSAPTEREPLFESLALLTGRKSRFYFRPNLPGRQSLAQFVLADAENPSSVAKCIENCRANARQIREAFPPELWMVINRLHRLFARADRSHRGRSDELTLRQALELEEELLNQFDSLTGAVDKDMVYGDNRHFWSLGVHVERALNTIAVLRPVLIRRPDPRTGELRRNEDHLDAMLGMLASRYAYRSLYQSRPSPQYVARLLLQDDMVPRSVLRCLQQIKLSLDAVAPDTNRSDNGDATTPLRLCGQLLGGVEFADLEPFFQTGNGHRPPRLRNWLDNMANQLIELSVLIGDHFLHHQAFNILR